MADPAALVVAVAALMLRAAAAELAVAAGPEEEEERMLAVERTRLKEPAAGLEDLAMGLDLVKERVRG